MTLEVNLKRINLIRRRLAKKFAWLILFCLCFSVYSVSGSQNVKSSNLVFCPLQRDWVKKYIPQVKTKEPLENICASGKVKSQFFFEAAKSYPLFRFVSNSDSIEKFFFNYLQKGKHALAEIQPIQNLPSPQSFIIAKSEKSAANFKTNFVHNSTECVVLTQKARPPGRLASFAGNTKPFYKLTAISRRIKPRAPPVSI
jgi:hypothetical protein